MKAANSSINIEDLHPRMKDFICKLESKLSKELIITSGYRGPNHPIEAKKTNGPGEHSTGLAVDVFCELPTDFLILVGESYLLGCRRIGVSRVKNFVHLGLDSDRDNSLWVYKN